ncbi:MAG: lysophospholipid acyltransferase family protein [Gemmatales bacterium]|nr:lysophospholipid acyltransferase family protein [Gemmatales bacterium]
MKIRHPVLIRLAATLTAPVLKMWMGTLSYRFSPECRWVHPLSERVQQRLIYAIWHEALLVPAGLASQRPVVTLISQHADGEWIAHMCRCFGVRVVRGSSRRGGTQALRELIENHSSCHVLLTPDGPRGPRRNVQPGVIYLASRTGLPIIPVGVGFQQAWRFRSWDRFALPVPGSTVYVVVHQPIFIPPDLNRDRLTPYCQQLQTALDRATHRAELWAANGRLPAVSPGLVSRNPAISEPAPAVPTPPATPAHHSDFLAA